MNKRQMTTGQSMHSAFFMWKKCLLIICFSVPSYFFSAGAMAETMKTYTLKATSVPRELVVEGKIEAINKATVTAETTGTVVEINFDTNDFVKKDQVLLRFRGTSNRAGYTQARSRVTSAKANLSVASSEYKRIAKLFKSKTVSKSKMDKASAKLKSAKAKLRSAKASLTRAEKKLNDTVIRAPYDGYVKKRYVEMGETAKPGSPLFTGMSLDQLRVLAAVPQSFVTAINKYKKAVISIRNEEENEDREIPVTNMVVFPFAKQGSYNVDVRLGLEKGLSGIFPGMLVKVIFHIGKKQRLLIPKSAIIQRSEVTGVYVLYPEDKIRLRLIRTGSVFGDKGIEVLAGLDKGDKVILDPIIAGQKITRK